MQYLRVCFMFCLCGVALATQHKSLLKVSPGGKNKGLGITGGTPASSKSFPYQAGIKSDYFSGAGAIVGKKFILTSADLVNGYTPAELQVRVGSNSYTKGGQLMAVEKVIIHEKFDTQYSYDVGLLKLSKSIKYGKSVKPIRLATQGGKNGTTAVVVGYGSSNSSKVEYGNLKQGKQSVFDKDSCQTYYNGLSINLDKSNSCAYSPTVCPCSLDFGDPLVQKHKLLGTFIGGAYCCDSDRPQIYTNAPAIIKWVKQQMKAEGYNYKEDVGHYFGE